MSINWVMLHETEGFIRLPQERIIYTSPPRTSLSLQSLHPRPGNEPLSIQSSTGCVHLTNQRIVYLPMQSTPQFQSFQAPLLNLRDTHVSAPFFGPNVWTAQVQPTPGGGIPPSSATVQLRMTFKDGGAFDFHSAFEKIKERLQQAVENVDSSGLVGDGAGPNGTSSGANALAGVDFSGVHLEQLPAYEGPGGSVSSASPTSPGISSPLSDTNDQSSHSQNTSAAQANEEQLAAPTGPPPGYEEVQRQSVANELENNLRRLQ